MRRLLALLVAAGLGTWLAGAARSGVPLVAHPVEFQQTIARSAGRRARTAGAAASCSRPRASTSSA
jgi:hypothetical protein